MTEEELMSTIPENIRRMIDKLPVIFDWVEYKGETVFAGFSLKRQKSQ